MRRVYLGAMLGALVSLGLAQPVLAADRVRAAQPVPGQGRPARLAQLGYDLTEGGEQPGQGIVATPAQAEDLRAKGFTVTAPYGEAKTAKAAPPDPFATNPTYG